MTNDINPRKYATDTMAEVAKQLITLSAGFIVLTVSLLDVMLPESTNTVRIFWMLVVCWIALVASILTGLLSLGSIATTAHDKGTFDVDEPITTWLLRIQQVLFVLAFSAFVWFASVNHGT